MWAWLATSKLGRIVAAIIGTLALVAALLIGKGVYDRNRRREGRDRERQDRLQDHVEAIEEGREAARDTGDSPRARRLRRKYQRD